MSLFTANIAHCVDLSFAWDKNTESDMAGYYIYYKTGSSGAPYDGTGADEGNSPIKIPLANLSDPENPEYTIHGLSDTEASFFVITSYDTNNNESGYSNELSFPNAHNDIATVAEDSGINNINVTDNDDFGGDGPAAADISITSGANNGTAVVNNGGSLNDPTDDSIDYTPNQDFFGTDTVTYEICDSDGDCDSGILTITVIAEDDSPSANDDAATIGEDSGINNINVTDNDDFGGDGPAAADISITSGANNGTATVNNGVSLNDPTDDSIDYTPNQDFFGNDNVTYEICDSDGDCDSGILTITVIAEDDSPSANDDAATIGEDSGINNINVTDNDDFGGDGPAAADISITSGANNGTATVNNGGFLNDPTDDSIDYTPNQDFFGNDNVTYEICDNDGDCDSGILTITVIAADDFPSAYNDAATIGEDSGINNINVADNDDFGGDGPAAADISITSGANNGTATVNNGGSLNDPTDDSIDYTPNQDFFGNDNVTYEICDSDGDCDTALLTVTVFAGDDTPTANNDAVEVAEDSGTTNINVIDNDDFGGDGPASTDITVTTGPGNGAAAVNNGNTPNDPTDDSIDYTPNQDFFGTDTVTYEICDSDGDCDTALLTVTVFAGDDIPTANNDAAEVAEDSGTTNINVIGNDDFGGDGPASTDITITTGPGNGAAAVNNGNTPNDPMDDSVDYTPNPDFFGTDTVTYEICDSDGDCDTALLTVTVTVMNDTPTANNDAAEVAEDSGTTNINVIDNDDFGGDGPASTDITVTTEPGNGAAAVNNGNTPNDPMDDSVDYTPNPDFFGTDTVTYEICDSDGDCDSGILTITVTAVDDALILDSLSISGDDFVNETSNANYTAVAVFSDGSTQIVTGSTDWNVDSLYANINSSGKLTTSAVPSNEAVTIEANYTHNGMTETATKMVTIIDVPVTLGSLSINGNDLVNENSNAGYTATANFSDGSTQTVTGSADWSVDSPYASINSNGVLATSEVPIDETVTIEASYTHNEVTGTTTKMVTIVNVPVILSSLSINGNDLLNENSHTSYTATATFSDGSTQIVTDSAGWSVNSPYASIDSNGGLTTSEVPIDETVTIEASYTHNEVTGTTTKMVTIVDVPVTLNSLSISGYDLVNENSSASYTATAIFSDGSTQIVTDSASWSEDSSYAQINSSAVLTTIEVSSDVTMTIEANYTDGGLTESATRQVTIVDVPASNLPPSTPNIMYPENGQYEVEVPLDIATEPFSDPNGDSHSQTCWQISEQSDFATLVVEVTSDNYLTTFSVPHMVLKPNRNYYLRVRFYDVYSEVSDWSGTVEFTTSSFYDDLNSNGIPDGYEVDDSVDFNLDGIPDNYQPEIIKCVQVLNGSSYIGVEIISDSISEIEALEVIDPSTIPDTANRPDDLTFGLIAYRLRMNQPGATALLRIYFSGGIFESDTFVKYDTINGWQDYSDYTIINVYKQAVTLELKDGSYGDSDGLENGIIVDPSGIASESTYTEGGTSTGGSDISECFIATAAFGSKFEKHVRLLRRFRDLYLMPHKTGRAFVNAYYTYSPPMADFIAKHDTLRMMVRWSLLPLVNLSWMLLHLGVVPTLLLLVLMISAMLVFCGKIRINRTQNFADIHR